MILQSNIAALLKHEITLSESSLAYDKETIRWVQEQLTRIAKFLPGWQLPVPEFNNGVFDDKLTAALTAFQKKLGLASLAGVLDADTTRALLALSDYAPERKVLGNFAGMEPEQALKKGLLWAGPNRFYPEKFLRPVYANLQIQTPPADAGLMLFTDALSQAIAQLELLDYNFMLFRNQDTEALNIIYKEDGDKVYGLIIPEEAVDSALMLSKRSS
jgi:hypothetical protein